MMKNTTQFEINSELAEVRLMAEHFQKFCKSNQLDETLTNLLELALVEALNNIIIHAYENVAGSKINAEFKLAQSLLSITLTDYGKEFKHNDDNENTAAQSSETPELAEGSWGLDLMDSISDEVIRYRENKQNILIIKKSVS